MRHGVEVQISVSRSPRAFAPDPLGEFTWLPRPSNWWDGDHSLPKNSTPFHLRASLGPRQFRAPHNIVNGLTHMLPSLIPKWSSRVELLEFA